MAQRDPDTSGEVTVSAGVDSRRIAYLLSAYPLLSETFILREITQLRVLGFEVHTASINGLGPSQAPRTVDEQREAAATFYVKPRGPQGALRAHASALVVDRRGWLHGLVAALRLGRFDLEAQAYRFAYLSEALIVAQWMRRHRLDHLHVHLGGPASTVAMLVKEITGCGLSITIHGPDEFYDAERLHLRQKIVAADFVCCISNFARSQLMKLSSYQHWPKFDVVRLGVDPERFAPPSGRDAHAPWRILCVGRLSEAKGHHVLVEAVERLVRDGRQVRLDLVGEGPSRASLEALVEQRQLHESVIFHGAVNQDEIRRFYRSADAFALTSFAEGIPVVLMEAMSMELPCVSTHIAGIPELISDGENGLLVPASDVEATATALARLMDDPMLGRRLGQSGRETVIARYDLATNVAALAAVFERRLSPLPGPG